MKFMENELARVVVVATDCLEAAKFLLSVRVEVLLVDMQRNHDAEVSEAGIDRILLRPSGPTLEILHGPVLDQDMATPFLSVSYSLKSWVMAVTKSDLFELAQLSKLFGGSP
jgi:hypothetical protein